MNLGIRDVSGLITSLSDKTGPKRITNAMNAYNDDRRQDVWMRTTAVDVLNRMLISPSWPLQGLRGAGLHLLNSLPALKRAAIRTGFGQ